MCKPEVKEWSMKRITAELEECLVQRQPYKLKGCVALIGHRFD